MKKKSLKNEMSVIGWREWVGLPDMGIDTIKVKVDTGARSSSLHVFDVKQFQNDGESWIRFKVHPEQKKATSTLECEAKLLEYRSIRSSSGKATIRPVILTNLKMLGACYPVELTLASRDEMGFRMLLGREAFRSRFLVDAGRSYYGGKPPRKQKNKAN